MEAVLFFPHAGEETRADFWIWPGRGDKSTHEVDIQGRLPEAAGARDAALVQMAADFLGDVGVRRPKHIELVIIV
ncbi:MAG: hypothetical protein DMG22_07570 [Acidobacteria bacterium]|nr:MAG: hypothetical protein DMG22_07570 [Acidobacteriota bacterium]